MLLNNNLFKMNWFPDYKFILASKSPRRQQLLEGIGIKFNIRYFDGPEDYPTELTIYEIPVYLAENKARPFEGILNSDELVIAADTIVSIDDEILTKPADIKDGIRNLKKLSGRKHKVITGICLKSSKKQKSFYSVTEVTFKVLTEQEIEFYLNNFLPYDKAGAYGIQEWIGYIGITEINGSFFNVMGLPVQELYEEIQKF